MGEDNVVRLRRLCWCTQRWGGGSCEMCVAADEIERLRAELQQSRLNHLTTLSELQDAAEQSHRLRAERDAERALADQLAEALCQMVTWSCCPDGNFGPCGCGPDVPRLPEGEENAEAIAAYEEARREQ